MKNSFVFVFFLCLSLSAISQTNSPDGKFSYIRSLQDRGDHTYWRGSIVNVSTQDTLLVIHNYTHDEPAPIAHWSGSNLVFHEGDSIKIYNPTTGRIIYSKKGIIWNHAENFFDSKNNILFFLRSTGSNRKTFDLFMLNVTTLKEKLLQSFITSGDPITGIPNIVITDKTKRELLIEIETQEYRSRKILISY